jgi:formamidopyrimidine-DNA glycosylase
MTGQLTVVPSEEPAATHTHLVFSLDHGGRRLRFRDIRRFGSVTRFADASRLEAFFQASGLGPEPFEVGRAYWRERLATTERCLKAVLLDQQVVAGVGNIYADESLFEARLHPGRLACRVEAEEAERLRRAIVKVLTRAIHSHGSTIRDYVGGSGLAGCYQDKFRAYGRTGLPCPRCQVPIERVRLAGRSTHFCPRCQSKVSGPLARAAR